MDYLCLLLLLLLCNTREFIFFLRYSPFREVASNGSYSSYWWGRIVACVSSVSIICHYYLSMVINGWKQTKKKSRRKVTISISTNPRWIIYYDTPIRRTPIRRYDTVHQNTTTTNMFPLIKFALPPHEEDQNHQRHSLCIIASYQRKNASIVEAK